MGHCSCLCSGAPGLTARQSAARSAAKIGPTPTTATVELASSVGGRAPAASGQAPVAEVGPPRRRPDLSPQAAVSAAGSRARAWGGVRARTSIGPAPALEVTVARG
jgi:hypothetical protein